MATKRERQLESALEQIVEARDFYGAAPPDEGKVYLGRLWDAILKAERHLKSCSEDSSPSCGTCGEPLTAVRPGKYQCDNEQCGLED